MHAQGSFDISLTPQPSGISDAQSKADNSFGRQRFDKSFSGELSGESKGEMLSTLAPVPGSAGYVAIELFTGTLAGRRGSFVLQHFGTRSQGDSFLLLEVVPDSGTGELIGLAGKMQIQIENGIHIYHFEYQFAE